MEDAHQRFTRQFNCIHQNSGPNQVLLHLKGISTLNRFTKQGSLRPLRVGRIPILESAWCQQAFAVTETIAGTQDHINSFIST